MQPAQGAAAMTQTEAIDEFAAAKLAQLDGKSLRRSLEATERGARAHAWRAGADLLSFCDNDYLGLTQDKRVIDASIRAAERYGAGAGGSRLIAGECPLNAAVEERLAEMKQAPAARLFGSGYLANIGVIPVIAGQGDYVLLDSLCHACLHAGAALSGATVARFRHNDVADAARLLENAPSSRRTIVITETIFSMDGDAAPLAALNDLCDAHGAWLITDDAHGFGVAEIENPAPVQMGTLSKAAGAYGGYMCGPQSLAELLINRARSFVYTTGLPPAILGAIYEALAIIRAAPALGEKARSNARLFARLIGAETPAAAIVPLLVGTPKRAMRLSSALKEKGFLVGAIRPPTVPEGTARLRFTFSAAHEEADVRRLGAALQAAMDDAA